MLIKASCGRLPKSVSLNDQVYSLTIIADGSCITRQGRNGPSDLSEDVDIQRRLLSVLYKEARDGNLWYWCERMRKARAMDQPDAAWKHLR
jgi:hypothetical protein